MLSKRIAAVIFHLRLPFKAR